MEPIPSSEGIVANAGLAPLPKWLDQDGNGLADWQEPAHILKVLELVTGIGIALIPSNTVTWRIANWIRTDVLPRLDKPAAP